MVTFSPQMVSFVVGPTIDVGLFSYEGLAHPECVWMIISPSRDPKRFPEDKK